MAEKKQKWRCVHCAWTLHKCLTRPDLVAIACTGITRCVTSHPVTRNTHISSLMTWPELAGLAGSGVTR